MIDTVKRLRMVSILHKMKNNIPIEFEGLQDTLIDRIVYLSFAVEWIRGKMEGQDPATDLWNRKVSETIGETQDN